MSDETSRRAGSGEARLTEAEAGALPLTDDERRHGQVLDGVLLFHEVAVGRILADRAAGEGDLRARITALCDEADQASRHHWPAGPDGQPSVSTLSTRAVRTALAPTEGDDQ